MKEYDIIFQTYITSCMDASKILLDDAKKETDPVTKAIMYSRISYSDMKRNVAMELYQLLKKYDKEVLEYDDDSGN